MPPLVRFFSVTAARETNAPRLVRHSGLQKQVLSLYRECLRTALRMSSAPSRIAAIDFARDEFRSKASLAKLDIQRIEFLLRQGKKRLKLYMDPATKIESFAAATARDGPSTTAVAISEVAEKKRTKVMS